MSGVEGLGEALVPGVRVVRLMGPVRIEIETRGAGVEPGDAAAVEAEWARKRAINPRFFDAPVLSVRGIDAAAGVVRCVVERYKRLVVQPEVETGVRQLSVTGVVVARDGNGAERVLLGRRSHRTRMYGGMWQNCPAGGIDPEPGVAARGGVMDQGAIAAELMREVEEEAGLKVREVGKPVAIIYDETARSHDLIVPVDVGGMPATVRGWEYDELRWVKTGEVAAFEVEEGGGGKIMAITRAVFRVMGWAG